jgi:cytochrome c oxidase subunit II
MKNSYIAVAVIVAIIIIGGVVLMQRGSSQQAPVTTSSETPTSQQQAMTTTEPSATGEAMQGEVKNITVTAKQFSFEPSEIRVKQGDKVHLTVKSVDVTHGLLLSAFNVNLNLEPNEEVTADFVADKKGTFPFICNVLCGVGHKNMTGNFIVE